MHDILGLHHLLIHLPIQLHIKALHVFIVVLGQRAAKCIMTGGLSSTTEQCHYNEYFLIFLKNIHCNGTVLPWSLQVF